MALACLTSPADGLRAGLASSGFMNGHFAEFCASGGSPWPKPLSAPVQSSRLNQSPLS